jgi:hypothetical protein
MKKIDVNYRAFMLSNYPKHAKKIFKANSQAWFSRIFFPMTFFIFPAAIFSAIGFFLYFIKQPNVINLQNQDRLAEFINNIPLKSSLMVVIASGSCFSLFCFFIGLYIGFSRASIILFEAEKLEISTKKLWIFEKIENDNSSSVTTASYQKSETRQNLSLQYQEPEL